MTTHKGKGVLLVADHDALKERLRSLLGARGLQVELAVDGLEAITRLGLMAPQLPAVLIMPAALPRLDGFQVSVLLRQSEHFRSLRIVLLTAQDCLLEQCRAQLAGVDALLRQPFSSEELRAAMGPDVAGAAVAVWDG